METEILCPADEAEEELTEADNATEPSEPESEENESTVTDAPPMSALERLYEQERSAAEYAEFCSLFPGVTLDSLPDSVRQSVEAGVPLSAAYALYEKKKARSEESAANVNGKNAERSFRLNKNPDSDSYFSADEVRRMSQTQVRENYDKILLSMRHWG